MGAVEHQGIPLQSLSASSRPGLSVRASSRQTAPAFAAVLLLSLLFNAGSPLQAQLPVARLRTLFPPGGQAGTSVEVTVAGSDLEDLDQLLFESPGLTAVRLTNAATGKPEPDRFRVMIASNTPAGFVDVRGIGRFGITNPRPFAIDELTEYIAPTTNRVSTSSFEVPMGSVINARVAAGNADYFRIRASRGSRLLLECFAKELDSRLDSILVLFDATGREITRSRGGEPLDLIPASDGDYVLKLHDRLFRGGDEYYYRLAISARPKPWFVLPGATNRFQLFGDGLPDGTIVTNQRFGGVALQRVEIPSPVPDEKSRPGRLPALVRMFPPALAGVEGFLLPAPGGGPPIPGFWDSPDVVQEIEPNDSAMESQQLTLPAETIGQFHPAGDVDSFQFEAQKGEVWWIEVASHRLGRSTDPVASVQRIGRNEQGVISTTPVMELPELDVNPGGVEFNTASRDPGGRLEIKESGSYRLVLRDLFGTTRADPRNLYHLAIRRVSPGFRLAAYPVMPPPANRDAKVSEVWSPLLRRGETLPIRVIALRRDGFTGPIDIFAEDLPAGVTAAPARMQHNANATTLLLTAAEDAGRWTGPLRILGKAKAESQELNGEAIGGTVLWSVADYNNEPVKSRCTTSAYIAVSDVEMAPVSVAPTSTQPLLAAAGTKLTVSLQLVRRGEFTEALKLKASGLSALDGLKEIEFDPKTNTAHLEIDLSQIKLEPGTYSFFLTGQTKGKYRNNPEAAAQAAEALKAAEEELTTATSGAKQAAESLEAARKLENGSSVADLEAAARSAEERIKAAAARKATMAEEAKQMEERAKPREVLYTVYSVPIQLVIQPPESK